MITKIIKFTCAIIISLCMATTQNFAASGKTNIVGTLEGHPLWLNYAVRFLNSDGRIIDNANGNISHSEGQGYGMLLALAANDRAAFAKIYGFAKSVLAIRNDSLFAWRFNPSGANKINDPNNASDGDLLIAWALLEAATAGWDSSYQSDGLRILSDLSAMLDDHASVGLVIRPGEKGFKFEDGTSLVNLSYWIFPAFERIASLTGDAKWMRLVSSGEYIVDQFLKAGKRGVPDWMSISSKDSTIRYSKKKSSDFGYDAVRVPLYLMMSKSVNNELAGRFVDSVVDGKKNMMLRINNKTGDVKGKFNSVGYRAVVELRNCVYRNQSFSRKTLTKLDDLYYPATLQLLSVMTAKQEYSKCL